MGKGQIERRGAVIILCRAQKNARGSKVCGALPRTPPGEIP
jgi:hypothetical protein